MTTTPRLTLGQGLVQSGLISRQELNLLGANSEPALVRNLLKRERIDFDLLMSLVNDLDLQLGILVQAEAMELLPARFREQNQIIPFFRSRNELHVGMVKPDDLHALDDLQRLAVCPVRTYPISAAQYQQWWRDHTTVTAQLDDEQTISQLVDAILQQALRDRASDVHLEPTKTDLIVRFRIDGLLRQVSAIPESLKGLILSRIKIMGNLDIGERRIPQDGRRAMVVGDATGKDVELDLRISTLPTLHGEKIVIRLLPQSQEPITLKQLGFDPGALERYAGFVERAQGLILITGPTGSGKTSTLYASLMQVQDPTLNIVTIEDPIEYQLAGINQVQVHPKAGLTFANGLRSILRQDPDVIMVGEIRDAETASTVFQSALTGHLVLSTIHTNDSVSAVTRLIDMGIEPYLIASATIGVVAQRLVRLICLECKMPDRPDAALLMQLGLQPDEPGDFARGQGCAHCFQTGYRGREAIVEVLLITPTIRDMIHDRSPDPDIRRLALKEGMVGLTDAGINKAKAGRTTIEELVRVVLL
ncbi:MAG: type II/IV secretion system protein [Candidatus Sericytochromatia bacterium]|nr:type II/IV secretion system protein [Candidatus Sericytochromatia bacterium]